MPTLPIDWPAILESAGANPAQTVCPVLIERCERLAGCRGSWRLHLREPRHTYGRPDEYLDCSDSVYVAHAQPYLRLTDWPEMLAYCIADRWRNARLLFLPDYLDDNCSWPGGYRRSSIYEANANVVRNEYTEKDGLILESPSLGIDPRSVSEDLLEAIESLQSYPVLDDNEWTDVEAKRQEEAWESWTAADWRKEASKALHQYAPDGADGYRGEEIMDKVSDSALYDLFRSCCDETSTYWEEESDGEPWIRLERAAAAIDRQDLIDLTGLALLPPDQEWRREPYPWPGAEPSPLELQLPINPAMVEVPE
jgi:hypothetical protein